MEISLKKPSGNVGTRVPASPVWIVPTLPEGFFNDISMTNIAIYIIKMNNGTIVVLITFLESNFEPYYWFLFSFAYNDEYKSNIAHNTERKW